MTDCIIIPANVERHPYPRRAAMVRGWDDQAGGWAGIEAYPEGPFPFDPRSMWVYDPRLVSTVGATSAADLLYQIDARLQSGGQDAADWLADIYAVIAALEPACQKDDLYDDTITTPGTGGYVYTPWIDCDEYAHVGVFYHNTGGANPTVNKAWKFASGPGGTGITTNASATGVALAAGSAAYGDHIGSSSAASGMLTMVNRLGARSFQIGFSDGGGGLSTTVRIIAIGLNEGSEA